MPYINKDLRSTINLSMEAFLEQVDNKTPVGNLNYIITQIILKALPDANYQRYNDIVGVLECCKLELYRRKISIYEDNKKESNGDVY